MPDPESIQDRRKVAHHFQFATGTIVGLTENRFSLMEGQNIMEFSKLIKKRQSVRKYSLRPVPRPLIDKCLEAARLAPSSCNNQPWSFIVADDEKVKNELADKAFSDIYSGNSFAKNAPLIIVVITEEYTRTAKLFSYVRETPFNLIDIGIACEHLILQAAEEGIGTCAMGMFNEEAVKKVLGLAETKKVHILISMGYPADDEGEREKKRKSLDEIRRYFIDQ